MEWSNDLVIEFLELYEKEPIIWNPRDPNHKNRNCINDAWKRIGDNISVACTTNDQCKDSNWHGNLPRLETRRSTRHGIM